MLHILSENDDYNKGSSFLTELKSTDRRQSVKIINFLFILNVIFYLFLEPSYQPGDNGPYQGLQVQPERKTRNLAGGWNRFLSFLHCANNNKILILEFSYLCRSYLLSELQVFHSGTQVERCHNRNFTRYRP